VTRPRAADDFATIRARIDELRRERDGDAAPGSAPTVLPEDRSESERRRRARIEGLPPHWVPTIFIRKLPL
jgi:hypothetical protein